MQLNLNSENTIFQKEMDIINSICKERQTY